MKVAVAYAANEPLVLEDVPTPDIGPRDVLVRISASGICHTDLNVIEGKSALPLPTVPGHEACGVVEAVGPEVRRVRPGDRVLSAVSPACGSCWSCLNGMSNHCENRRSVDRFALPDGRMAPAVCAVGAFAEAMVVDEGSVVAMQTDLPDEQLALLGCGVTTGLGAALITAKVTAGSSVVVIGCGAVGQSVVQGARISGASTIVAVDLSGGRRQDSLRLGATHAVDPAETDALQVVRDLTNGRGADFTFECVGSVALMQQAFAMARKEGAVTLVGMPPVDAQLTLPAIAAVFSGKSLKGSVVGGAQILRDFPRFVKLAETGQLDLASMVSKRIALEDVNEGIALLHNADGVRTVIV